MTLTVPVNIHHETSLLTNRPLEVLVLNGVFVLFENEVLVSTKQGNSPTEKRPTCSSCLAVLPVPRNQIRPNFRLRIESFRRGLKRR